MVRRWIYYLASLIGCFIFYAAYQGWLAWLLLCCLFWLPLASLVLSLPAMLTASAKCLCGGNMTRGQLQQAEVKVSCPLPLPHYRCRVTAERPLTGGKWVLKEGQPLPADHVGALFCRLDKCRIYDYLGLFSVRILRRKDSVAIVRPSESALKEPADLHRFLSRAWKPKPGGGYAENHELRLYRPGDNLNQVHWKLTAKTGKLMIREPMEPVRGAAALTMDIKGDADMLDLRFGQLLWMGKHLLEQGLSFDLRVLTGNGIVTERITKEEELYRQLDVLLGCCPAAEGSVTDTPFHAGWHYHIGGNTDEA